MYIAVSDHHLDRAHTTVNKYRLLLEYWQPHSDQRMSRTLLFDMSHEPPPAIASAISPAIPPAV